MAFSTLHLPIKRIVSGGQTGVDRAGLDVAIELGIEHGGWCPLGRLAEDGPIPLRYQLRETNSTDYSVRTLRNVLDSDGTLLIYRDRLMGGTLLTQRLARDHGRSHFRIRLDLSIDFAAFQDWLRQENIVTLNVAGPRASSRATIGLEAFRVLKFALTQPATLFPEARLKAKG